ncbi:Bdr family repetitive protein [Borreliella garinii]|uniref:Bdr family repetitive protein n=1 Tax=Borreliella garinii TaxID=29519 RepID=UPI001AEEAB39|nr:Bdr family repetitive protein [Borreliella garinii]
MKSVLTTNITEEQIYKAFLRPGMEQLIAQDLSTKRYYHNELTYRDLENLEKQFGIKFENLDFKIDTLKNELNAKIDNVEKNLKQNFDSNNRLITIMSIILVPIAIAIIGPFVMSLITGFFKR